MTVSLQPRLRGIAPLVGNTPLLKLHFAMDGKPRSVFAKAENFNFTGSIKDRMALHILERGYAEGRLAPEERIAEATSGNTGISFAALGRALGHEVDIYMPDWMSQERIALIQSFGATVHLVSREEGGFVGAIELANLSAQTESSVFLPSQFANDDNVRAHLKGTGPEIAAQLVACCVEPAAFVAGVGTGGTVMGVGRFLKRNWPSIAIHPLEPANSPTLSTGFHTGRHRIQGISDEFIPPIVHLEELDEVIAAADGDAILMAQKLAGELGLGVGISSGANVLGAMIVQGRLGPEAQVVTILPDCNKKYLSTDLLRHEPAREDYITPRVTFLGFETVGRVCGVCADPVPLPTDAA